MPAIRFVPRQSVFPPAQADFRRSLTRRADAKILIDRRILFDLSVADRHRDRVCLKDRDKS